MGFSANMARPRPVPAFGHQGHDKLRTGLEAVVIEAPYKQAARLAPVGGGPGSADRTCNKGGAIHLCNCVKRSAREIRNSRLGNPPHRREYGGSCYST